MQRGDGAILTLEFNSEVAKGFNISNADGQFEPIANIRGAP
jgi:hypothetical protein